MASWRWWPATKPSPAPPWRWWRPPGGIRGRRAPLCRHPVGSGRIGQIIAVFEVKKDIPSRILHGKILPPLHRRNDGVSTCPERFTIRKSAYLQRNPLGRRAGEGRNHGSLHFLVGRRGGQRIADAIPGRCVL